MRGAWVGLPKADAAAIGPLASLRTYPRPFYDGAGRQARGAAAATQERSNCLDGQGTLWMFVDGRLAWLPGGLMCHPGVQDRQQLAPAGRQGDFLGFAHGTPACIEGAPPGMMAHGHPGAHRQRGAPRGAAAPHRAVAAQGPTLPGEGRHPDQGGTARAAQGASLGKIHHEWGR
jgi:hypothetical protein